MAYEELKERVYNANMGLVESGLVVLTWGNASGVDRKAGVMAIKPSGVDYEKLKPADIVVVSLDTGNVVEGTGKPSSDTPTHLHLYRTYSQLGGIIHTHSTYATAFAQANRPIPCYGTTHADSFYGDIPITRPLTSAEIRGDYELNTGKVIEECFQTGAIDVTAVPGVLVASHAPFAWGPSPEKAMENAIVLEQVALMAILTQQLNPAVQPVPKVLLDKHYLRKHGPGAYYGQK